MQEISGKNLLLIRLSSLGDIIFNIPLANKLKQAGYRVTWLVSEKGTEILENNPCVDEVVLVPFEKWRNNFKKFNILNIFQDMKEFFVLRNLLKEKRFDIIIDTQGKWKSLLFTAFSGVKRRIIGSDSTEFAFLGANETAKVPPRKDWNLNVIKKYLLYAEHLGINTENYTISLPPSGEKEITKIDELLSDTDKEKPLAVLCPVTTWETKHWAPENWKQLVKRIDSRFNIVFTGTKKDIKYIEYINENKHPNFAGKTSLKELIELFRRSDIVISLDSGSTHLANASCAKRIVSIYCSTPKNYYEPIGENYKGLTADLPCQPCHKKKCRLTGNNHNACTKLPGVDEVLEEINNLMK